MASLIQVPTPSCLDDMAADLEEFVKGMVAKLAKNAHKDTPTREDVPQFILLMQGEILELYKQYLENRYDPNFNKELHDIANFAFLTMLSVELRDVNQMEMFNDGVARPKTESRLDNRPVVGNLDD